MLNYSVLTHFHILQAFCKPTVAQCQCVFDLNGVWCGYAGMLTLHCTLQSCSQMGCWVQWASQTLMCLAWRP